MKKKITIIITLFCMCILFIFLLNTKSYAGYQSIDNLNYDVELNEDGTVDIVETWEIYVSNTNTLFKTFELDDAKYGEITNVKVAEVLDTGETLNFTKTDEYAYHVQKGYYYGLETSSNEFEIAWGVSIDDGDTRTYKISYTIVDGIKTYNDCSEFYWQFIGTTNEIDVAELKGTIKLPTAVKNKEDLKVWAHGPLNGEIQIVDNETVSFEVSYLYTETMVETRIAVLENIFTENQNKVDSNRLDSILSEETQWANEANAEREKLLREEKMQEIIEAILGFLLVIANIGIIVFYIVKIVKYAKALSDVKVLEPETKIEYFRDFPDKEATPGDAAFLYYFDKKDNFKKNISKIVSATILDLALKKVISFEEDDKNNIKIRINYSIEKSKLRSDELSVYQILSNTQKYIAHKNDQDENETTITMKDIEKYAKNNDRSFLSNIEGIESNVGDRQADKENYDKKSEKISEKWRTKKVSYYTAAFVFVCLLALMIVLPALFLGIIFNIVCGILCSKLQNQTRTLTQKGVNEKEEWAGLKRYMENFSLLDEREVPELVLWEEYMVFATAFGIADKVLSQLKVKYPEVLDEYGNFNSSYTYLYMMNRYNFDRMIGNGIQRAYNAGISARNARQAASSGGSFSSRRWPEAEASQVVGGRRRRPEAGMGGR